MTTPRKPTIRELRLMAENAELRGALDTIVETRGEVALLMAASTPGIPMALIITLARWREAHLAWIAEGGTSWDHNAKRAKELADKLAEWIPPMTKPENRVAP